MNPSSLKLLIVEESLRDEKAHWFEYVRTIQEAAQTRGVKTVVACHRDASDVIRSQMETLPIFAHARYLDGGRARAPLERYYGWLLHNLRVYFVLRHVVHRENYDVAFAPTVLVHHLLAWYWLMSFSRRAPRFVTLFFVTNPGVWNEALRSSSLTGSSRILGWALRRFRRLVQSGRVRFAVETEGAKREFEQLSGLPFEKLSHPVPFASSIAQPNASREAPPRKHGNLIFATYGFARYEKGSDLLLKAVQQWSVDKNGQRPVVRIQWLDPFHLPDGTLCHPTREFSERYDLELITSTLSREQYLGYLQSTSVSVLPYRNASYHARLSRVAIESVCCGIPVIYTTGGWLEELVLEFGAGVPMNDESSDSLTLAMCEARDRINELWSLSQQKSCIAKKHFAPEQFLNQLLSSKATAKSIRHTGTLQPCVTDSALDSSHTN